MSYPRFSSLLLFLLAAAPLSASAQLAYPEGYVIWGSDRQDSRMEVYRSRADGSEVTRLTTSGASLPAWSPDGRWISYMDDANDIYLMRPDGSELQLLMVGWQVTWMHDNSGLLVAEGGDFNIVDPETGEKTPLFSRAEFPQFDGTSFNINAVTHDNRYVLLGSHLYINGYTGANGSIVSEYSAIVLDLLHKDKLYFVGSGCWPFTPPLGDLVFHICANCPNHPDIYRMHLADLDTRSSYAPEVAHEDPDWGHEYNPRVSNDNQWIAYMASAGCHQGPNCDYDIWLHRLGTDPTQRLRVTQDPSFDGYPQLYVGPMWQPSTAPRLLVTPNRLTFFATSTSVPTPKLLKLKNTGGGVLAPSSFTLDGPAGWLDIVQDAKGLSVGVRTGAITRGTQCVNLTITVPGAVASPVTIPITLIADDSFPASAVDGGTSEAGAASDGGTSDGPIAIDVRGPDGASVIISVDASSLDCDALVGPTPDGGVSHDAPVIAPAKNDSGCSCRLGGHSGAGGLLAFALVGLALLLRRRSAKR